MMGHLQDCSSLHDPPGRASSLGRPNPVSYPVSYQWPVRVTPLNKNANYASRTYKHVSGAGAENGAERAQKTDERERERERDLKKYGGAGEGGRVSGSGAVSGLNRPLTIRSKP